MSTRVSIVVAGIPTDLSSGLEETLESLHAQRDNALEVVVEKAGDLADALRSGFSRARGDIRAFLRPGQSLLPGAVASVREQIDPARNRHVVIGGAVLCLDGMEDVALRYPASRGGFAEHLQVWTRGFDDVPYSSLFWRRSAQPDLAGLVSGSAEATAFDFSCRLLERFAAHHVETPWSAIRVPLVPAATSEADSLAQLIAVSRPHWGGWFSRRRWRCMTSHWAYAMGSHDRARHHARRAEIARANGDAMRFRTERLMTALYEPRMARERLRQP